MTIFVSWPGGWAPPFPRLRRVGNFRHRMSWTGCESPIGRVP
ncbi:hypothetical protein HMPREF9620_01102 [Cutibacterium acnes HL037PA1]|nr:hypothetical protein HMPREF9620_01102 [Cutibacterium acnes HL037PA1]